MMMFLLVGIKKGSKKSGVLEVIGLHPSFALQSLTTLFKICHVLTFCILGKFLLYGVFYCIGFRRKKSSVTVETAPGDRSMFGGVR